MSLIECCLSQEAMGIQPLFWLTIAIMLETVPFLITLSPHHLKSSSCTCSTCIYFCLFQPENRPIHAFHSAVLHVGCLNQSICRGTGLVNHVSFTSKVLISAFGLQSAFASNKTALFLARSREMFQSLNERSLLWRKCFLCFNVYFKCPWKPYKEGRCAIHLWSVLTHTLSTMSRWPILDV